MPSSDELLPGEHVRSIVRSVFSEADICSVVELSEQDAPAMVCRIGLNGEGAASTLILKESRCGASLNIDELAAYEFLSTTPAASLLPRLYGQEAGGAWLLMEDVGDNQLGRILCDTARGQALRALLAFSESLGTLHAVTAPKRSEYQAKRIAYPPGECSRHRIHRIKEALDGLQEQLAVGGVILGEDALAEVQSAKAALDAEEFQVFTHGDSTFANSFLVGDKVKFIDLETSGYRHALLDGSFARLRYIHSVWAQRIPVEIQREMEDRYRSKLSGGVLAAASDKEYGRALVACSLGWLAGLCGVLDKALEKDQVWGLATTRQRIVVAAEHFLQLAEEHGCHPATGQAVADLITRLRAAWPASDCDMPVYKALS